MALELFLFDMDGTLVRYQESSFHSSWDALGIAAGKKKEWEEQLSYYYPRPELYDEWIRENCKILKGVPTEQVLSQLLPPPYAPGTKEFFQYLNQLPQKPLTGLVTSGIDLVANYIKNDFKIDFVFANEVHTDNNFFTGGGKTNVPLWKKGEIIQKLVETCQIPLENTVFFGDNENDIPAWEIIGLPIAINLDNNKPGSVEKCFAHVEYSFDDFYQVLEFFKSSSKI